MCNRNIYQHHITGTIFNHLTLNFADVFCVIDINDPRQVQLIVRPTCAHAVLKVTQYSFYMVPTPESIGLVPFDFNKIAFK